MGELADATGKAPEDLWVPKKKFGWGVRHLQMACMALCVTVLFVARGSMGVAVLAMTDRSRANDSNVQIYDWDKRTQGVVLSSFFWGYMSMQVPGGVLATRVGAAPVLLAALLANSVLCVLLPWLTALGGWRAVCALRVLTGMSQACLFPACHTLLGRWLPAHERTAIAGAVYAGSIVGTIVAMPVSGELASTSRGWPIIFYAMAALLLATAALWRALAASAPAQHRFISQAEVDYIQNDFCVSSKPQGDRRLRMPWRIVARSGALWAVVCAHTGMCAVFVLFFVDMPTYLEHGLGLSLKNSASLSALPYVGMWCGNMISSVLCEKISNRGWLSIGTCRRICNSISFYGVSVGLVCLSFLGAEHKQLAVATLVGALTLKGFCSAGFMMNHLDLSPNFAGVLLSLTNFLANSSSVVIPILTGIILRDDPSDVSRWRVVFLSVAALATASNTLYVVFSRFERQPWDHPDFYTTGHEHAHTEEMKPVLNREANGANKETDANKS